MAWPVAHRLAELPTMAREDVEELGGDAAGVREMARDDDQRHGELLRPPVEGDGRLVRVKGLG